MVVVSDYEQVRLKRLEENKKRMAELNIHMLAQSLRTPKPSSVCKPKVPKQPIDPNSVRRSSRFADMPPVCYTYKHPVLAKRESPAYPRKKKTKISELPDESLAYILSFLTLKEARRTSVLSKRWRYVWAYIPILNFDSCNIHHELVPGTKSWQVEALKYLHCVDEVVSLHRAPTIDEFSVQCDINYLKSTSEKSINNWFIFVIEKKVKRLEIDLSLYSGGNGFLRHTFSGRKTFSSLSLCNSLTSLELGCVNVTGDILKTFLCNCLALEYLSVKYSESLVEMSVVGPSLSLRSLRIYRCNEIKKLEISAPNLVSCYTGRKINVQFISTPKLVEVFIGDEHAEDLDSSFSDLSSYHSQIDMLSLHPCGKIKDIRILVEDPVFTRLKKLNLEVSPCWDDNLCSLVSLIKEMLFSDMIFCYVGQWRHAKHQRIGPDEKFEVQCIC